MLLAASSGFLGAGLFGVSFHVALLVVAVIWDSVSPGMDVDPDMSHLQLIYYGALGLGFLVFFAIGMSKLVKWVKIGQRLA